MSLASSQGGGGGGDRSTAFCSSCNFIGHYTSECEKRRDSFHRLKQEQDAKVVSMEDLFQAEQYEIVKAHKRRFMALQRDRDRALQLIDEEIDAFAGDLQALEATHMSRTSGLLEQRYRNATNNLLQRNIESWSQLADLLMAHEADTSFRRMICEDVFRSVTAGTVRRPSGLGSRQEEPGIVFRERPGLESSFVRESGSHVDPGQPIARSALEKARSSKMHSTGSAKPASFNKFGSKSKAEENPFRAHGKFQEVPVLKLWTPPHKTEGPTCSCPGHEGEKKAEINVPTWGDEMDVEDDDPGDRLVMDLPDEAGEKMEISSQSSIANTESVPEDEEED